MSGTIEQKNETIAHLLNGTLASVKNVMPLPMDIEKPGVWTSPLQFPFGALISLIGDIEGKVVLAGDPTIFGTIGEAMFGMPVEGDMLSSFSGELGNMIAAGLSTNVSEQGINTDISSPTIMEGDTTLKGFQKAIHIPVTIEGNCMDIYLLLD